MTKTITDALDELDLDNDGHWTADGDPKLDVVSQLAGRKVSRNEVKEAAPHFTRENPELASVLDEGETDAGQDEGQEEGRQEEVIAAPAPSLDGVDLHLEDGADAEAEAKKPESQQLDEAAQRVQLKIDRLAKERNRLHALASQAHVRETKDRDRHAGTKGRMDYIRAQTERRMEKVAAQKQLGELIAASGGNPAAVAASPLDAALRQRKPEIGSTRPDHSGQAAQNMAAAKPQIDPILGRNPGVVN